MSGLPDSLVEALARRARSHPDRPAFRTVPEGGGAAGAVWTWGRWADEAAGVARGLRGAGVGAGHRVAVLAGNVPLWPVADLGIQWTGSVSVGLYPTSSPAQVREVLADCEAAAAFVDGPEQQAKVERALPRLPALRLLVRPDDTPPATVPSRVRQLRWSELLEGGGARRSDGGGDPPPLPPADDDAVVIYTSGSTGVPRGARLAHRTLVASAESVRETLGLREEDTSLSFLPFCHAAERVFGLATRILVGMEAGLVADPARVFEAAAAYRPTLLGGLPRIWEKVYEAEVADRRDGEPPEGPAAVRLLGGRVRLATSGGATLSREVAETLDSVGLTVLGAYGLTEHLCAAFNRPDAPTFDTSGPPMPGTEIAIADDGEILVRRSDLTFRGYLGRPEATAEAFTPDGRWLCTGDLGSLDAEGRLRVTGRKKELIALSTGKKVAPARIEAWLAEQPWIERAVTFGEGRKFVSALLTLRRPVVEAWARHEGIGEGWPALASHPRVRSEVEAQVAEVNARVSRTESVRRFDVLPASLSQEAGELTPTLKVRRDVLATRHARRIDALYGGGRP